MSKGSTRSLDVALMRAALPIIETREGNYKTLFRCRHALSHMITRSKSLYGNIDPISKEKLERATMLAMDRTWVEDSHIAYMLQLTLIVLDDVRRSSRINHELVARFLREIVAPARDTEIVAEPKFLAIS